MIYVFYAFTTDPLRTKAEYLMLRGRALNVLPQYSKEAEDCLSKAIKLDPKLAEAWSYLGECYWKNNQVESARNCLVGSLSHVTRIILFSSNNSGKCSRNGISNKCTVF